MKNLITHKCCEILCSSARDCCMRTHHRRTLRDLGLGSFAAPRAAASACAARPLAVINQGRRCHICSAAGGGAAGLGSSGESARVTKHRSLSLPGLAQPLQGTVLQLCFAAQSHTVTGLLASDVHHSIITILLVQLLNHRDLFLIRPGR